MLNRKNQLYFVKKICIVQKCSHMFAQTKSGDAQNLQYRTVDTIWSQGHNIALITILDK